MRDSDRLLSVCICTYKRPEGLRCALHSLAAMLVPAKCSLEILVVDNEASGSASAVVQEFCSTYPLLNLRYLLEPTPGVSHARNRCLEMATGELIAFFDDDEFVDQDWLAALLDCMDRTQADAVFGPVLPFFDAPPSPWLLASGFNDRLRFPTGTELPWRETRTGNVMLRRSMIEGGHRFATNFARTGGEDSHFFAMAKRRGLKLIWCDEALVHETVTAERLTPSWVLHRAFMGGRTYVRLEASLGHRWPYLYFAVRGLVLALASILSMAANYRPGQYRHVRHLCKFYGHLGKIMARFYSRGPYAGTS